MFGRATIRLGIGPHSSSALFLSEFSTDFSVFLRGFLDIGLQICIFVRGAMLLLIIELATEEDMN